MITKRRLLIALFITLVSMSSTMLGSTGLGQQKQSLFVGVFKTTDPDYFKKGPRPEDAPIVRQHADYWRKLIDQGICVVAGHTLNHDATAFGLAIVREDSESSAREIMERSLALSPRGHRYRYRVSI